MLGPLVALVLLAAPATEAGAACDHSSLSKMDTASLRVRRNEVFARHGRSFRSDDLKRHFAAQPWYQPDPAYSDARLTDADRACVARVGLWESSRATLYQGSADLDGDGTSEALFVLAKDERLVSKSTSDEACDPACEAVLLVGDETLALERYWPASAYLGSIRESPSFAIVDVDPSDGRKELHLLQHYRDTEDPGIDNLLVSLIGGKIVAASVGSSSYNSGGLTFRGDGRIDLRVSYCPAETAVYRFADGVVSKIDGKKAPAPPEGCAACPYVDVATSEGWSRQGEILRYHVGPDAEAWQRLDLTGVVGPTVRVRISEEKDEVTSLDAVQLLADGEVIAPVGCSGSTPAVCEADGRSLTLHRGDSVELIFEVPLGSEALILEARGFYERSGDVEEPRSRSALQGP